MKKCPVSESPFGEWFEPTDEIFQQMNKLFGGGTSKQYLFDAGSVKVSGIVDTNNASMMAKYHDTNGKLIANLLVNADETITDGMQWLKDSVGQVIVATTAKAWDVA